MNRAFSSVALGVVTAIAAGCASPSSDVADSESAIIESTSAYTSLELSSDCEQVQVLAGQEARCPGMAGYEGLHVRDVAGRKVVDVRSHGHDFKVDVSKLPLPAGASRLGPKAEWRGRGVAIGQVDPYALIFRYFVTDAQGRETNHLIVSRLERDGVCILGTVSGAEPNHNEKARVIADQNRATRCPSRCGALRAGEELRAGQSISSCGDAYTLTMQADGNLVVYEKATGAARWDSRTHGTNAETAVMQGDGNLVIYGKTGPIWSTSTFGKPGAWLSLDDWGGLYVENPDDYGVPFWAPGSGD
jgi:hypothetical protein